MLNWNSPVPGHPTVTFDDLFVSMKREGYKTNDIIDVFEVFTGKTAKKLRHTIRMKENNHKFLITGRGLSHVSEAHCRLLQEELHPSAKDWLLQNKRWASKLI